MPSKEVDPPNDRIWDLWGVGVRGMPMRLAGGAGGSPEVVPWEGQWVDRRFQEDVGRPNNTAFIGSQRDQDESRGEEDGTHAKRVRTVSPPRSVNAVPSNAPHPSGPVCQVDGCRADLTGSKDYHRRHKVCEMHSKAATVTLGDFAQRFCQQCSRFHPLAEFDEGKRSCRRRLLGHNRRRRKVQAPVDGTAVDQLKLGAGSPDSSQGGGLRQSPASLGLAPSLDTARNAPSAPASHAASMSLLAANQHHSALQERQQGGGAERQGGTEARNGIEVSVRDNSAFNYGFPGNSMEEYQKLQGGALRGTVTQQQAQNKSQLDILQQMQLALQQRQQQQQREHMLDISGQGPAAHLHRLFSEEQGGGRQAGQSSAGGGEAGQLEGQEQSGLLKLLSSGGQIQGSGPALAKLAGRDSGLSSLTQEQAVALMSGSLGINAGLAPRSLLELIRQKQDHMGEQEGMPGGAQGQEGGSERRGGSLFEMLGHAAPRDSRHGGSAPVNPQQLAASTAQNWHGGF